MNRKIRTRLAGDVKNKNDPGWDRLPPVLRHPTVLSGHFSFVHTNFFLRGSFRWSCHCWHAATIRRYKLFQPMLVGNWSEQFSSLKEKKTERKEGNLVVSTFCWRNLLSFCWYLEMSRSTRSIASRSSSLDGEEDGGDDGTWWASSITTSRLSLSDSSPQTKITTREAAQSK